jgi:hypothetical protein
MQNVTGYRPTSRTGKANRHLPSIQYMLGIKEYWEDLCARGFCNLSWELLWNSPLKNHLHPSMSSCQARTERRWRGKTSKLYGEA